MRGTQSVFVFLLYTMEYEVRSRSNLSLFTNMG